MKIKIKVMRLAVYANSSSKCPVTDAYIDFRGGGDDVWFKAGNRGTWVYLCSIYKPTDVKIGREFTTHLASRRWEIVGIYEPDDEGNEPERLLQWGSCGFYKGRAVREYEADDDL